MKTSTGKEKRWGVWSESEEKLLLSPIWDVTLGCKIKFSRVE